MVPPVLAGPGKWRRAEGDVGGTCGCGQHTRCRSSKHSSAHHHTRRSPPPTPVPYTNDPHTRTQTHAHTHSSSAARRSTTVHDRGTHLPTVLGLRLRADFGVNRCASSHPGPLPPPRHGVRAPPLPLPADARRYGALAPTGVRVPVDEPWLGDAVRTAGSDALKRTKLGRPVSMPMPLSLSLPAPAPTSVPAVTVCCVSVGCCSGAAGPCCVPSCSDGGAATGLLLPLAAAIPAVPRGLSKPPTLSLSVVLLLSLASDAELMLPERADSPVSVAHCGTRPRVPVMPVPSVLVDGH